MDVYFITEYNSLRRQTRIELRYVGTKSKASIHQIITDRELITSHAPPNIVWRYHLDKLVATWNEANPDLQVRLLLPNKVHGWLIVHKDYKEEDDA
jgi:hypothetical protein